MRPISNLNSLSVKNYVPGSDTLAVIRELKKLGIIKGPKPKSKTTSKMIDDIKQESDMVGYVKTLEGQPGRQNPNIFSLRQIQPGMSQQQIEDLRQRNDAGVAALRAEVSQQRLEDIEQQQGQRFADITRLGGIMNPILERFRGAQEPGAGQRVNPFAESSTILLPDIQEETFTQSLNEGGPQAQPAIQTELFAGEESDNVGIPTAPQNLQPRPKVGGESSSGGEKKLRLDEQDVADVLGVGKIPVMRNSYTAIEDFYIALTDATDTDRDASLNSKSQILADIKKILAQKGEELINK
jgi:hypothetical protein